MQPLIAISTFAKLKDQPFCDCDLEDKIPEILKNLDQSKPGYREGVILVPISTKNFTGQIVNLEAGDKLTGSYQPRVPGEAPRKQIHALGKLAPLVAVDVVLYHKDVLAENNENSDPDADYEAITFLTKISHEEQPMPPDTLMANHFQASGGTATNMSDAAFVGALKESYQFWKDKATIPKD